MVSQPLWGAIADRAKTKNIILFIALILLTGAGLLFLLPQKSLIMLLICVVIFYFFFLAPQTLIDTITVENIGKAKLPFGTVRAFSSAGAAAMAFIFSLIHDMTDQKAFLLMAGASLLAVIPLAFVPIARGHAGEVQEKKASYADLLKNKRLMLVLSFGFFLFICSSMISTFFPVYYSTDRGLNAGTDMLGVFMSIAIILEAAIMIVGGKFFQRLNPYTVFMIAPLSGILRSFLIYIIGDPNVMLVCTLFQAIWYAPPLGEHHPFYQSYCAG